VQWSDLPGVWFIIGVSVFLILIFLVQSNRAKRLCERLELLAREMGWSEVGSSFFYGLAVEGVWNGYNVRIRRLARRKGAPERIVSSISVQTPARIIITRRQHGVFAGRPLTLFGPPLVDLPLYSQFWIRADEITLADRLMHSSAAAILDRILVSRDDLFRMGGDDLLIQRVSSNDPDEVARLAREELELLRGVIDGLALRP
jgi:hypothetical protein